MKKLKLTRTESGDQGTFGTLEGEPLAKPIFTIECPWRDNAHSISCVFPGSYEVLRTDHPKHGFCYELQNVKDRTGILMHSGNWAGDKDMGYNSNFEGCIGLGFSGGPEFKLAGQKAIGKSHDAVAYFEKMMAGEPFMLEIVESYGA